MHIQAFRNAYDKDEALRCEKCDVELLVKMTFLADSKVKWVEVWKTRRNIKSISRKEMPAW